MLKKVFGRFFQDKNKLFLLVILLIALFLRVYNIKETLLFHYDQGYHGLAIKHIWDNKDLTLLGHKTDVEGIFHSSLFYYMMLPVYLISDWNPASVSTILAAVDSLSIIFIYLIAKKLFDKKTGLISSLLYAISYLAISYSRWLSNVTLIPFLSSLMFYFLALTEGKNKKYFMAALFVSGVITQLNGAIGFFILLLLLTYLLFFRKKLFNAKHLIKYFLSYLLPAFGLILFDIRNNFLVSRSVISHFTQRSGFSYSGLIRATEILRNQIVSLLSYKIVPLTLAIWLIVAYSYKDKWSKKKSANLWGKVILFGTILYILELFVYQGIHDFFIVAIIPLLVIVIGRSISSLSGKGILGFTTHILLIVIILVNLFRWTGFLKPNFNLVPIGTRNLITLNDRLKALDFMYTKAKGKPFRTVIYIIPYYQEEPWDYILNWYAYPQYGYLPSDDADKVFTIHEPDYDYGYRLENWLEIANQKYGKTLSSFKSNSVTVEERKK